MNIKRWARFGTKLALVISICCPVRAAEKAEVSGDVKILAAGRNEFAVALYRQLQQEHGENLFFSPYNISSALQMVAAGAAGATEKQMAEVLHFDLPDAKLHPAAAALRESLLSGADEAAGFDLRVANRLWGQQGVHFLPEFLQGCRTDYMADLGQVDFSGQTEAAREAINAWIEKETSHKIRAMVPPGALSDDTRLVLTSAVYFKARWADVFDEKDTAEAPFHTSATTDVRVPLMHQSLHTVYADLGDFEMLVLPYDAKSPTTLFIFLPKKVTGLAEIERQITVENLNRWTERGDEASVELYLPKFKLSVTLNLVDVLKPMGMTLAFDRKRADFSRMCSEEPLWVAQAKHQAFVDVNEQGTEAAAATDAVFAAEDKSDQKSVTFRADRPFVFLIRDQRTGTILFLGRLVNPAE